MKITAAAVGFLAATLLGPALAQSGISIDDARRIAAENGVASIEEIERDDGKWEVEGKDASGREIEIEIDIATGKVLKIDR